MMDTIASYIWTIAFTVTHTVLGLILPVPYFPRMSHVLATFAGLDPHVESCRMQQIPSPSPPPHISLPPKLPDTTSESSFASPARTLPVGVKVQNWRNIIAQEDDAMVYKLEIRPKVVVDLIHAENRSASEIVHQSRRMVGNVAEVPQVEAELMQTTTELGAVAPAEQDYLRNSAEKQLFEEISKCSTSKSPTQSVEMTSTTMSKWSPSCPPSVVSSSHIPPHVAHAVGKVRLALS
jgi:hypothetical protein